MKIRDFPDGYGLVSILLHWGMAVLILGLFALGLYMVGLDYYHPWYNAAPDLHRVVGLLTGLLLLLRLAWRAASPRPRPLGREWERRLAAVVHHSLYLLTAALVASGYLTSTAEGHGIPVYGWFEVPALRDWGEGMEDRFGELHEWFAWAIIALTALHAAAALKHHYIDRDATLWRMLGRVPARRSTTEEERR
ncbi:MAG: cytochrome b [Gammaproteobacteria bacterium]|nr:MAG: cytochrome b [Gammaproteobacteria bacterium]